jgi:hypothetical protein
VIRVFGAADLDGLASASTIVLRGQVREYTLRRSPEERQLLFQHDDAVEPSLLPSDSRRPE